MEAGNSLARLQTFCGPGGFGFRPEARSTIRSQRDRQGRYAGRRPLNESLRGHYEVILTNHVLAYDMLAVSKKAWSSLNPEQQARLRAEADKAFDASAAKYNAQEQEAIEFFKKEGKQVYTPDQNAFRAFAQKRYVEKYGKDWPKDALERVNAIK